MRSFRNKSYVTSVESGELLVAGGVSRFKNSSPVLILIADLGKGTLDSTIYDLAISITHSLMA